MYPAQNSGSSPVRPSRSWSALVSSGSAAGSNSLRRSNHPRATPGRVHPCEGKFLQQFTQHDRGGLSANGPSAQQDAANSRGIERADRHEDFVPGTHLPDIEWRAKADQHDRPGNLGGEPHPCC